MLFDELLKHAYTDPFLWRRAMIQDQDNRAKEKTDTSISLESIIAMGLFGWIALSMALMGLGIW